MTTAAKARPTAVPDSTAPVFDGLAEALAWVQARLPHVHKDGTAQVKSDKGSYSYKYADLADVSQAILTLTGQAGLAWITTTGYDERGTFTMTYRLEHTTGQSAGGTWPLPDPVQKGPQVTGSALTYARRYALCCVTGVAPDKDDDGAQAQTEGRQERAREQVRQQAAPPAEPEVNVEGFTEALLEAVDSGDPNQVQALMLGTPPVCYVRWGIGAKTELPDLVTGRRTGTAPTAEMVTAKELLTRALAESTRGEPPAPAKAKAEPKVTRLRAGDPDEQAAQWQRDVEAVEGTVEDPS